MRIKSIITENDFVIYAPTLTKTDDGVLAANTYAWSDTLKAIHVNDASAAIFGAFRLPLGFLKVGDVVTISMESKNVSGNKARFALDYNLTNVSGVGGGTYYTITSTNNGEYFETTEITYTIVRDAYYSVPFGLFTPEIGEYYLRNCWVKCKTNYNINQKLYKKGTRDYLLSVTGGACTVLTPYGYDTATFAIDSTAKKITITHDKPFAVKAGIPFTQMDQSGNSINYYVLTRTATTEGCACYIYDRATRTLQDPALLTSVVFGIFFAGYDNEIDLI